MGHRTQTSRRAADAPERTLERPSAESWRHEGEAKKRTMKLDPKLSRTDRITNVVIGAALVAYAFLGPLEKVPVQIVVMGIGLVFIVGGFGGT